MKAAAVVVLPADEVLAELRALRAEVQSLRSTASPWLDADAVAALLGVDRRTVMRKASLGKLPGRKVGRAWRFRSDEIDGYIRGR